jgi:hypothetical protein
MECKPNQAGVGKRPLKKKAINWIKETSKNQSSFCGVGAFKVKKNAFFN